MLLLVDNWIEIVVDILVDSHMLMQRHHTLNIRSVSGGHGNESSMNPRTDYAYFIANSCQQCKMQRVECSKSIIDCFHLVDK